MANTRRMSQLLELFTLRVTLPTLLLALFAPAIVCEAAEQIDSHWITGPLKVDGDGSDWENYPIKFFRDQEVSVGLVNDSTDLYVMMRFRDPKWMRTIRMSGLNLYFDNKGGKKKRFTLTYRGGPDPSQLQGIDLMSMGPRGDEMPEGMKSRMDEMMKERQDKEFVCAIDDKIYDKAIPTDGSEGPKAAAGYDAGFFTYEFRVPLQENVVRFYGMNATPGGKIGVGVMWDDMSEVKKGMREDGPPSGGMPGGGMGGGPPGGGMGGPRGGESELPKKQEIWIKSKLAAGIGNATGE